MDIGAWNKTANCLSWLIKIPNTPEVTSILINMVVTSTPDGPATCTCSKTKALMDTMPLWTFCHHHNRTPLKQVYPHLSWKTARKFYHKCRKQINSTNVSPNAQWQSTTPWCWHFHPTQWSLLQTCQGCHKDFSGSSHPNIMAFHSIHQSAW